MASYTPSPSPSHATEAGPASPTTSVSRARLPPAVRGPCQAPTGVLEGHRGARAPHWETVPHRRRRDRRRQAADAWHHARRPAAAVWSLADGPTRAPPSASPARARGSGVPVAPRLARSPGRPRRRSGPGRGDRGAGRWGGCRGGPRRPAGADEPSDRGCDAEQHGSPSRGAWACQPRRRRSHTVPAVRMAARARSWAPSARRFTFTAGRQVTVSPVTT